MLAGTVNTGSKTMKRNLLIIGMIALILMGGCSKEKEDQQQAGPDNKALVAEIFKAGMAWSLESRGLKSSLPITIGLDHYQYGVEGGHIHLLGSIAGHIVLDDQNGQMTGGELMLEATETFENYTFKDHNVVYTVNGAPDLSLTGDFTLMPGSTYGATSTLTFDGGVRVTGSNGYDQTINIQLTIHVNADGSGGYVSGTISGSGVDFTIGG